MSQVSEQKAAVVEKTVDLLKKYDVIAAADLFKVQSGMLMDLRKSLRGQLEIKTIKNTLMRIKGSTQLRMPSQLDRPLGRATSISTLARSVAGTPRLSRVSIRLVFSSVCEIASLLSARSTSILEPSTVMRATLPSRISLASLCSEISLGCGQG